MSRTLPPMLQVMRDIGGVEVPEFLAKLQGEPTTTAKATPKPSILLSISSAAWFGIEQPKIHFVPARYGPTAAFSSSGPTICGAELATLAAGRAPTLIPESFQAPSSCSKDIPNGSSSGAVGKKP